MNRKEEEGGRRGGELSKLGPLLFFSRSIEISLSSFLVNCRARRKTTAIARRTNRRRPIEKPLRSLFDDLYTYHHMASDDLSIGTHTRLTHIRTYNCVI
jgi:hypothetical protein